MSSPFKKAVSKILTSYFVCHDAIFGSIENYLALSTKHILIIPQAGIGDQILSISAYKQLSENHVVHLMVKEKHFDIVKALLADSPVILHSWTEGDNDISSCFSDRFKFRSIADRYQARIISLSDLHLRISRFGRPDINPIGHVYRILRLNVSSYNQKSYFRGFIGDHYSDSQLQIPLQNFALLDHFPGTPREIPIPTLNEIEGRGLKLEFVPKDVPFWELNEMILRASEIHVVNSSFLCWCLIINPACHSKNIYISQPGFLNGHNFYDNSWVEWDISESQGYSPPKIIDRGKELASARNKSNFFFRRFVNLILYGSRGVDQL